MTGRRGSARWPWSGRAPADVRSQSTSALVWPGWAAAPTTRANTLPELSERRFANRSPRSTFGSVSSNPVRSTPSLQVTTGPRSRKDWPRGSRQCSDYGSLLAFHRRAHMRASAASRSARLGKRAHTAQGSVRGDHIGRNLHSSEGYPPKLSFGMISTIGARNRIQGSAAGSDNAKNTQQGNADILGRCAAGGGIRARSGPVRCGCSGRDQHGNIRSLRFLRCRRQLGDG